MDYSLFLGPVQALLGALCAVLWASLTETKKKAEKVEADLAQFKVDAATNFTTKHEMRAAIESLSKVIEAQGNRIESRFDKIEDRLSKMLEHKD
jgi:Tfp pilus assembly protein PilF